MADKKISELPSLATFADDSLLVVEQNGSAGSVRGALVKEYAFQAAQSALQKYPIIKNGTWWLWNGTTYTDSGYAAQGKGDKGDTGKGLTILDFYTSVSLLESSVSSPEAGDAYGVGTAAPYDIYIYSPTQGWVNSGPLQGVQGEKGETPVKGEDYWTEADKAEIVNDVLAGLPTWTGGSY